MNGMTSMRTRYLTAMAAAAAALLTVTACGGHSSDHAASAASSAMADPSVSADASALESQLLAAYQQHFSPAHPVQAGEDAIHQVFPAGDTAKITTYGVQHLTPAMATSKAARQAWADKVVTFALGPAAASSPSPGATVTPKASA